MTRSVTKGMSLQIQVAKRPFVTSEGFTGELLLFHTEHLTRMLPRCFRDLRLRGDPGANPRHAVGKV